MNTSISSISDLIERNRNAVHLAVTDADTLLGLRKAIPLHEVTDSLNAWTFITLTLRVAGNVYPLTYIGGYSQKFMRYVLKHLVTAYCGDRVLIDNRHLVVLHGNQSPTVDVDAIHEQLAAWGVGEKLGLRPYRKQLGTK